MTHSPAMQGAGLTCAPDLLGNRSWHIPATFLSVHKVRAGTPNQGTRLKPHSPCGTLFQSLEQQVFSPLCVNPHRACSRGSMWTLLPPPSGRDPPQVPLLSSTPLCKSKTLFSQMKSSSLLATRKMLPNIKAFISCT